MSLEEIIPFLIFVFWIVRSIITQKRKAEEKRKKPQKAKSEKWLSPTYNEPKPKRRPPIIFEAETPEIDILEELFGKKEKAAPKIQNTVKQPVTKMQSANDMEFAEKRIAQQMKKEYNLQKADFKEEIAKAFEQKQVHKRGKRNILRSKPSITKFNLKKAVIYSEILRRPYE